MTVLEVENKIKSTFPEFNEFKIIDNSEIYCNRTSLFDGLAIATLKWHYRHSIIRDQKCFDIVMEIEFPNGNTAYYTIAYVSVNNRNEWNLEVNNLLTK